MPDQCIVCAEDVRPRQHGIMCDSCQLWQHRLRTCGTGKRFFYILFYDKSVMGAFQNNEVRMLFFSFE